VGKFVVSQMQVLEIQSKRNHIIAPNWIYMSNLFFILQNGLKVLKHRLAYVHNCKLCYSWSLHIQWLKLGVKNPTRLRPVHFADIVERGQICQSNVGVENPIQWHLKVIAPNFFQMRVLWSKLVDLVTKTKYC
jgi:hypothetical protein